MAQIIKKIKVKKADGTFSEDIPLGIDAEHIYLSDNKTIEEKIDDLDAVAAETLKSKGSCTFAQLPTPAIDTVGNVYNITDNFTTTSSFIEGAGHEYPAGVNVAIIKTGASTGPNYQYDIIGGMGIPDLSHKEDKVNKVTSLSSNSTNAQYPSAKIVYEQLQRKQDKLKAGTNITIDPDTNTISATGGGGGGTSSYIDLTNKPQINGIELTGNKTSNELGITIPTKTSDLTNDGPSASIYNSYVATNQPNSALYFSNPNSVTARYGISANSWNNIVLENTINKVTAINTNSTDTEYPSAKAVYDYGETKQNILTAGTNITIDENNVISATGTLSTDYSTATNKPQINGTELVGNITSEDLKLVSKLGDTMTGALTTTGLTVGSRKPDVVVGPSSVAFGYNQVSSGPFSVSHGFENYATGHSSHAEGNSTTASRRSVTFRRIRHICSK